MKRFLKSALIIPTLFLTFSAYGQNDLSNRIAELKKKDSEAVIGCGVGGLTLITDKGEIKIISDLTDYHVFGPKVVVAELTPLLEARVETNRTGKRNAMSGDVGHLTGRIIYVVSRANNIKVVPVLAALLEDEDIYIYRAAAYSLLEMAKTNDDCRREIEKVTFPRKAISGIFAGELPVWLKIREVN